MFKLGRLGLVLPVSFPAAGTRVPADLSKGSAKKKSIKTEIAKRRKWSIQDQSQKKKKTGNI